ncbi:YgjP-like metallopeptidase domain-containing protein [Sulfurospirillum arcachonense]|uniref:YgjP-like metallopeptidase domain-containing protein n=1 Tax=Sulfurospirillum arcachonense TaxID=57666 RepID=UPI00046AB186|nr:YgjP-like metallopeptidase domain-containing protein [Sulfurospirillum arcachonense]
MKYISHYPQQLQDQIQHLIDNDKLGIYLEKKYPKKHSIKTDKTLYSYVMDLKNEYLKKFQISKVLYDGKINDVSQSLGTHTFISRVQGGKLKAKNIIKVATIFKDVPEEFLKMIVVHELAHFKEKEHNKAFYKFCEHMQKDYHQVEFDVRVYLLHLDILQKRKI